MKVSKTKLKQIIKEEVRKHLKKEAIELPGRKPSIPGLGGEDFDISDLGALTPQQMISKERQKYGEEFDTRLKILHELSEIEGAREAFIAADMDMMEYFTENVEKIYPFVGHMIGPNADGPVIQALSGKTVDPATGEFVELKRQEIQDLLKDAVFESMIANDIIDKEQYRKIVSPSPQDHIFGFSKYVGVSEEEVKEAIRTKFGQVDMSISGKKFQEKYIMPFLFKSRKIMKQKGVPPKEAMRMALGLD